MSRRRFAPYHLFRTGSTGFTGCPSIGLVR